MGALIIHRYPFPHAIGVAKGKNARVNDTIVRRRFSSYRATGGSDTESHEPEGDDGGQQKKTRMIAPGGSLAGV